jgi:hypothetical protein
MNNKCDCGGKCAKPELKVDKTVDAFDEGFEKGSLETRRLLWHALMVKAGDARVLGDLLKDKSELESDTYYHSEAVFTLAAETVRLAYTGTEEGGSCSPDAAFDEASKPEGTKEDPCKDCIDCTIC